MTSLNLLSLPMFLFGAVVGSFLNVCIVRIPRGDSIVNPPSHCPDCKTAIRFYDNIPLVSYVALLGRCRSCGERISSRYFFVELLMGSLAVALHYQFGLSLAFLVSFIFVAALIVISFIDLDVRIVPDVISLPGIVAGLVFSVVARYVINDPFELIPSPLSALIGILVGGGFLLALAWAYEAFTGVEGMGGGDIKLLAMIGAFLGWTFDSVYAFFCFAHWFCHRAWVHGWKRCWQEVRPSLCPFSLPRSASLSFVWPGFDSVLPKLTVPSCDLFNSR